MQKFGFGFHEKEISFFCSANMKEERIEQNKAQFGTLKHIKIFSGKNVTAYNTNYVDLSKGVMFCCNVQILYNA